MQNVFKYWNRHKRTVSCRLEPTQKTSHHTNPLEAVDHEKHSRNLGNTEFCRETAEGRETMNSALFLAARQVSISLSLSSRDLLGSLEINVVVQRATSNSLMLQRISSVSETSRDIDCDSTCLAPTTQSSSASTARKYQSLSFCRKPAWVYERSPRSHMCDQWQMVAVLHDFRFAWVFQKRSNTEARSSVFNMRREQQTTRPKY